MSITCGKCGVGVGSLDDFVEHLESGLKQQVVRCTICGWRKQRMDPESMMERIVRPSKKVSPLGLNQIRTETCIVAGCEEKYSSRTSKRKMCSQHSRQMSQFLCGKSKEPPCVLQDGVWIENPNRTQKGQAA